jgi:hypothetical protein
MVTTSSLSDLKEIGCKSVWLVHPVTFSLRFFKSDRLPADALARVIDCSATKC